LADLLIFVAFLRQDYGQRYRDEWILPSLWFGVWNFASPGASMIGSVIGGLLQDWLGRRTSLAVGSILTAIGVAIIFVSNISDDINVRRSVLLAGKAFQGGAIGIVMVTAQTYMSEILPTKLRGSVLAFFPTFTLLGQLIGAAIIKACSTVDQGYRICFAVQWPFSILPLFVAMLIPESPIYLVRKGKFDRALKAQERLDPPGMDTQLSIDLIKRNIEHERQQSKATYVDCFKGTNLRRTLIIVFANLLPQVFGLMLLSKASYFMQVVGMEASLSLLVLVAGIACGLIANLVSIWVLSLYGRRVLTLLSLAILAVLWTSMGIAGIWSGEPTIW
jgi:MFS family permease